MFRCLSLTSVQIKAVSYCVSEWVHVFVDVVRTPADSLSVGGRCDERGGEKRFVKAEYFREKQNICIVFVLTLKTLNNNFSNNTFAKLFFNLWFHFVCVVFRQKQSSDKHVSTNINQTISERTFKHSSASDCVRKCSESV